MTLVSNRASAKFARRRKALNNLVTLPFYDWANLHYGGLGSVPENHEALYKAYVERKREERTVLEARTSAPPTITHTRKRQVDGWTEARRSYRAGKGI